MEQTIYNMDGMTNGFYVHMILMEINSARKKMRKEKYLLKARAGEYSAESVLRTVMH